MMVMVMLRNKNKLAKQLSDIFILVFIEKFLAKFAVQIIFWNGHSSSTGSE